MGMLGRCCEAATLGIRGFVEGTKFTTASELQLTRHQA
jgi:hypothetical protein